MARGTNKDLGDSHGKLTRVINRWLDSDELDIEVVKVAMAWMKQNGITGDPDKDTDLKDLNDKLQAKRRRTVPTKEELQRTVERLFDEGGV